MIHDTVSAFVADPKNAAIPDIVSVGLVAAGSNEAIEIADAPLANDSHGIYAVAVVCGLWPQVGSAKATLHALATAPALTGVRELRRALAGDSPAAQRLLALYRRVSISIRWGRETAAFRAALAKGAEGEASALAQAAEDWALRACAAAGIAAADAEEALKLGFGGFAPALIKSSPSCRAAAMAVKAAKEAAKKEAAEKAAAEKAAADEKAAKETERRKTLPEYVILQTADDVDAMAKELAIMSRRLEALAGLPGGAEIAATLVGKLAQAFA